MAKKAEGSSGFQAEVVQLGGDEWDHKLRAANNDLNGAEFRLAREKKAFKDAETRLAQAEKLHKDAMEHLAKMDTKITKVREEEAAERKKRIEERIKRSKESQGE